MIKFLKASAIAAGVLGLAAISSTASAANVFDDFITAQSASDTTTNASGVFGAQVTGGIIFGGYREVYAFKGGTPVSDAVNARAAVTVNAGRASFSTDAASFGYGLIRWDGITQTGVSTVLSTTVNPLAPIYGASTVNSLGDLTAFGSGFKVTYSSDHAFDITILIYTATGIFGAGQPVANTNDLDVSDTVLFSEFVLVSGTGTLADIADTRAVEVIFNGELVNLGRLDMDFAPPISIPEPATLGLVGLALLGIGASRRRKA